MGKLFVNRKFVFAGFFVVMLAAEIGLLAHHGAIDELFRIGSALYLAFVAAVISAVLTYVWLHLIRSAQSNSAPSIDRTGRKSTGKETT